MWVCRDARSVRPFHSKCVHIYVVFWADARLVRPYTPWTWSNPTPFATQSRLYGCVKRFVLSHKPDFWSTFPWLMFFKKEIKKADKKSWLGLQHVHGDFAFSIILFYNMTYFAGQSGLFCKPKWATSAIKMADIDVLFQSSWGPFLGLVRKKGRPFTTFPDANIILFTGECKSNINFVDILILRDKLVIPCKKQPKSPLLTAIQ